MDRVAIRISRFEDQDAYRRVLSLLCGLYPDRAAADFEQALARLPCLVSHDADLGAAEALQEALEARGASVRVLPADTARPLLPMSGQGLPTRQTMLVSPEVDLDFLRKGTPRLPQQSGSARAVPTRQSMQDSEDWTREKAPWEE
ncbi:MAG: hypothetical protein KDA24_10155 [Deltaproteobacteria bacterium]|nr:hypothetical protein [Deltaproteobacteria bacterium]